VKRAARLALGGGGGKLGERVVIVELGAEERPDPLRQNVETRDPFVPIIFTASGRIDLSLQDHAVKVLMRLR